MNCLTKIGGLAPALLFLTGVKSFKGKIGAGSEVGSRRREPAGRSQMRYLKYAVVVGIIALSMSAVASAQVRVGVVIGVGPGYVGLAPVCAYGYYPYAPYACSPYGYWGPDYFVNGVFIGAGPWFHGFYGRGYYGHGFYGRGGDWGHGGFRGNEGFRGGFRGGNEFHGGNGFHGGGAVRGGGGGHSGGGFHGGGGGHGGGHR